MNYREDKHGNKLSALGFGCMRFTKNMSGIIYEKAEKEILYAIDLGVNYFDTAYIYPGSEALLGEVLEKNNLRDKIYIATKLPHYMMNNIENCEKTFNEELTRLRTDHIDYYLLHMLNDDTSFDRILNFGIDKWLKEKLENKIIRQIGFSYHGNTDTFKKIIDKYDWDFCQIQYNYLDESTQAGVEGLKYASEKSIPVIIMEPLQGGRLSSHLPNEAVKLIEEKKQMKPAEFGLRWLYNQKEVTVVLSGMNSIEMIEENVYTASNSNVGDLNTNDFELYEKVKNIINEKIKVPCTACRYCMPCPHNVDIPGTFAAYNNYFTSGKFHGIKDYMMCTEFRKVVTSPKNCVECGLCEKHCPQSIKIRTELKNARKTLEFPFYNLVSKIIKAFMKY